MTIRIYTKTLHKKVNGKYFSEMVGVIQGSIKQMLKHYPNDFAFLRHETKQSMRSKKIRWD